MEFSSILKNFIDKYGVRIVSDGDWDGILASAIILRWLRKQGYKISTEMINFPHPASIPYLKLKHCIIIEITPTRGYKVEDECILIDHHNFKGVFRLKRDKIEPIIELKEEVPSVATLVSKLLTEGKEFEDLLKYIELVDLGRTFEHDKATKLHKAYLIRIEDSKFRYKLLKMLIDLRLKELWEEIEKNANAYDVLSEIFIPQIFNRVKGFANNEGAFTWYSSDNLMERIYFREVMLRLEERYKLVVVAAIKKSEIDRLHIGSRNGQVKVNRYIEILLETLRSRILGGGREVVGGIQFRIPLKIEELNSFIKILEEAYYKYKESFG